MNNTDAQFRDIQLKFRTAYYLQWNANSSQNFSTVAEVAKKKSDTRVEMKRFNSPAQNMFPC